MASRDYLKHVVSTSEPTDSALGDEWYNPSTNILSKRLVVNGTTVRFVPLGGGLTVQQSGTTIIGNTSTLNFPGASVAHNPITGVTDISASGVPGGLNTQIQFNNSGAFAGSSNLTWNGSLLNVTGRIETNGSRVLDYKNATAQWTMSGGGLVTWTGASILWNTRVICIPVENNEMGSSGHFDITCPTSGTVVYYNSVNVTTTLTCTAAGIPLGAWEALYYEVTEGMASTSDQTRFRVVNYTNTTWRPSTGWLLVAAVNGEGNNVGHIKWLPGQINLPTTGATVTYNTGTGISSWAVGAGTVTSVSVASANGFAGTVATSTSTPAITISTSITGLLKGNGTAISAATAGTDYQTAQSVTGIVKSSGTTRSAAVAGTDYQAPVSATGLLKSNGTSGNVTAATAGTDYQTAQSVTGIVKSSGTTRSAAVAGTDYQAAQSVTGIVKSSGTTRSAAVAGTDYVAPSGTFFIGTTSIAHNRASASLSLTGTNIDGSAGSAGIATTVTTTASTTNSAFKIPMVNTTGVATGNFGLLLDSTAAGDFTFNPSTNTLTVGTVISTVNFGAAGAHSIRHTALGTAQGQLAGESFYTTFVGTADNGPRRSADIWSGFNAANWGSEFLAFGVGNNGGANDAQGITIERLRINGGGSVIQAAQLYYDSFTTGTAAGSTQGTALVLTNTINNLTTVAANTGVRLPAPIQAGARVLIRNSGANVLRIYPAVGGQINTLGTNVALTLDINALIELVAFSTTQWYTVNATFA